MEMNTRRGRRGEKGVEEEVGVNLGEMSGG